MSSYGRSIAAINKELDRLGAVEGYANSLSGIVKRLSSIEIGGGGGEGSSDKWELLWENEHLDLPQEAFTLFDSERMTEIRQEYSELKILFQKYLSDGDYYHSVTEMFMSTNTATDYGCEYGQFVGYGSTYILFNKRNVIIGNGLGVRSGFSVRVALNDGTITSTENNSVAIVVAVYGKKVNE